LPIVREMIGVHRRTARAIMVEEHEREGLPPFDAISEESTLEEDAWLENASAIFAPNAHVHDSLVASGIPEEKILQTSYGWSPERFPRVHETRHYEGGLVLLFVGRVSYAKGAHLLLRAWREAGHPGRLLLAGTVEPGLAQRMSEELNHESVEQLGFVTDLAPIYASANAFALPTLFEGGPQVTLEGAAHGLPTVVSPMGTGRLVDHGVEGFVIEPHDIGQWSQAITDLARDPELRRELGNNARLAADRFRWENVSRERAVLIKRFLTASRESETADRRQKAADEKIAGLSMAATRGLGK